MANDKVLYEIREHIGVISTYETGWCKELNLIAWNGQPPKYDVRDWNPQHDRMSRGVTLYEGEMHRLVDSFIAHNNRKVIDQAKHEEAERRSRNNIKRNQFKRETEVKPEEEALVAEQDNLQIFQEAHDAQDAVDGHWDEPVGEGETQCCCMDHDNHVDAEAVCENII